MQIMLNVIENQVLIHLCFLCPDFSLSCIGYPGQQRARGGEVAKFGRPVSD
jgi:hypothetical protein